MLRCENSQSHFCITLGHCSAIVETGLQYTWWKPSKYKRSHLHPQTLWEVSSNYARPSIWLWMGVILSLSDPFCVCVCRLLLPYECHVKGISIRSMLPHHQPKPFHFVAGYSKEEDDSVQRPAKRRLVSVPVYQVGIVFYWHTHKKIITKLINCFALIKIIEILFIILSEKLFHIEQFTLVAI